MSQHLKPGDLPVDIATRVEAAIAAGRFATADEVVRAGLDELEARDHLPHDWADYLRYRFEEGRRAISRGEYVEGSPAELMARIRARVEAKPL